MTKRNINIDVTRCRAEKKTSSVDHNNKNI